MNNPTLSYLIGEFKNRNVSAIEEIKYMIWNNQQRYDCSSFGLNSYPRKKYSQLNPYEIIRIRINQLYARYFDEDGIIPYYYNDKQFKKVQMDWTEYVGFINVNLDGIISRLCKRLDENLDDNQIIAFIVKSLTGYVKNYTNKINNIYRCQTKEKIVYIDNSDTKNQYTVYEIILAEHLDEEERKIFNEVKTGSKLFTDYKKALKADLCNYTNQNAHNCFSEKQMSFINRIADIIQTCDNSDLFYFTVDKLPRLRKTFLSKMLDLDRSTVSRNLLHIYTTAKRKRVKMDQYNEKKKAKEQAIFEKKKEKGKKRAFKIFKKKCYDVLIKQGIPENEILDLENLKSKHCDILFSLGAVKYNFKDFVNPKNWEKCDPIDTNRTRTSEQCKISNGNFRYITNVYTGINGKKYRCENGVWYKLMVESVELNADFEEAVLTLKQMIIS